MCEIAVVPVRPRLRPAFRPVPRGAGTVQLGSTGASGGFLLTGLSAPEVALVGRLDGSLTTTAWYASARASGVDRRRAEELLALLRDRRLLAGETDDRRTPGSEEPDGSGPVRAPPAGAHVVVSGTGLVPVAVGALLRAGDVGRVDVGPWAEDLVDAQLRAYPTSEVAPDLVVPVTTGRVDARAGQPWRRRGVPVLPVVLDGPRVVVGPLVGRDAADPCLTCLQLTRTGLRASDAAPVLDDALVSVAAGVAAMLARSVVAGDAVPRGVSVEAWSPWPRLEHRRWERHPACPDHPAAGAATETSPRRVTMTT